MAELLLTLGASSGAIKTIGTIASVAGPVLGVVSAIQGNAAAKEQASEFSRQAREERVTAGIAAERRRRAARVQQSRDRVSLAEGGALSGTSLGLLDQNAVAQELDALTVEYQGEQAGRSADFRAQQARKSASPLNVFSAAIKGFSQIDPLNFAEYGGAGPNMGVR
jgi:hypothetical protein